LYTLPVKGWSYLSTKIVDNYVDEIWVKAFYMKLNNF